MSVARALTSLGDLVLSPIGAGVFLVAVFVVWARRQPADPAPPVADRVDNVVHFSPSCTRVRGAAVPPGVRGREGSR